MSFLLKKVQQEIENTLKNTQNSHFLLAISGGIDSMILLDIFHKLNLSFHVAHANFQLRGQESEQDEVFVLEQSKKYLPQEKIHIERFNTLKEHEKIKDTSIQMLARKLRYEWFQKLLHQYQLDYIVTAHHADDNIETFFLKLFRKSNQGLSGMEVLSEKCIFRPLLNVFRHEIELYAEQNNISYREDSSNIKDDYLRNHIRHHLVPFIENHYPKAKNAVLEVMHYQKDLNTLAKIYIDEIWNKTVSQYEDCYNINLKILAQYPEKVQSILPWYFAERLHIGMKQFDQFKHLFQKNTKTNKSMLTQTHKAVRYKQNIEVFPINKHKKNSTLEYKNIKQIDIVKQIPEEYILIKSDFFMSDSTTSMVFISHWLDGDKILHKGKHTLIADLIPEYKITPYQKEYLYVVRIKSAEVEYPLEILFAFFCPNSLLLQLTSIL